MRRSPRQLPVLDLLGTRALRFALPLAVAVDEGVREDPEQPGLEVRPLLELMERSVGLRERFLHQVFGVRRMPRHAHGRRVQLVQVRQHVSFEAFAALPGCLWYCTHPLRVASPAWPPREPGGRPTIKGGEYRAALRRWPGASCGERGIGCAITS